MCTVIGLQGRGEDLHKKISLTAFRQEILFKGGDGFGFILLNQNEYIKEYKTNEIGLLITGLKEFIPSDSKSCYTVLIFSRSKPETEDVLPHIKYGQPYSVNAKNSKISYVHHGLISSPEKKGKFEYTDSELFKEDFKNGALELFRTKKDEFFNKYQDSSMAIIGVELFDGHTPNLFAINNYLGVWFKWEHNILTITNSRPHKENWFVVDDCELFKNQFTPLYFSFPYDVTHAEKRLLCGFVEGISIDDVLNESTVALEEIVGIP